MIGDRVALVMLEKEVRRFLSLLLGWKSITMATRFYEKKRKKKEAQYIAKLRLKTLKGKIKVSD